MFFLGLAGSFMPYLLLFGALFVLTMGVNLRGDANEELAEITKKTIEYQDSDNQESINETNCYYFHSSKETTIDHQVNQAAFFQVDDFLITKHPVARLEAHPQQEYLFQTYHTFFGLSPPAMVS